MKTIVKTAIKQMKTIYPMKNSPLLLIGIILIYGVAACSRPKPHEAMHNASLLMTTRPDSALQLLENIDLEELNTHADSAWYALLLTQARDKNHIRQTDSSLISSAVAYYEKHRDTRKLAQAYFYWGGVCRDTYQEDEAQNKYHKAYEHATEIGDTLLLGHIHCNQGFVYYNQGLYDEANAAFAKMQAIGMQLKDTNMIAEAIVMQGDIAISLKHYTQAEEKLLEAAAWLQPDRFIRQHHKLYSKLSRLYYKQNDKEKALQYAKLTLSTLQDSLQYTLSYILMGQAYSLQHQYDSAVYYLNNALENCRKNPIENNYAAETTIYRHLAVIAKRQENWPLYKRMNDSSQVYYNKYNEHISQQKLAVVKNDHKFNTRQQLTQVQKKQRIAIWKIILVSMIIVSISTYFVWKYKKRNRKLAQHDKDTSQRNETLEQQNQSLQQQNKELEQQTHRFRQRTIKAEKRHQELRQKMEKQDKGKACAALSDKIDKVLESDRKEHLQNADWDEMKTLADPDNRLDKYQLSCNELHCCLLMLFLQISQKKISAERIGLLLGYERSTFYRIKEALLQKLETKKNKGKKLQDILLEITGIPTPESQTPHE